MAVHSTRAIRPAQGVQLEADRSQVMADAGTLDTGGEVVADLALVGAGELAPEEGRHVLGLDHMHGGAHDGLIQRLEGRLLAEHDVGGVFRLHEAPVVARAEVAQNRAEALRPQGEPRMEQRCAERVGELLRLGGIGDEGEGVVEHREGNARLEQLAGQPGVAIEVDLQAKRRPGRNADVTQAELLIDEVEVVMQAFAGGGLKEGAMGRLVMPGSVRGA